MNLKFVDCNYDLFEIKSWSQLIRI